MNVRSLFMAFSVAAAFLVCNEAWPAGPLTKGTLVFVANPSGNWELFVLRAGASSAVQLTRTPLDERAPSLSPDGKRVAYATSDGALWVMELATARTAMVRVPKGTYGYPSWLRDGSGILYTSYQYTPPQEDADVYVHLFKTGTSKLFLMQTGPQDYASLSPNGDRVTYVSSIATTLPGFGSTVTQQVWVASLRLGTPSQLFMGSAHDTRPAWSRDGRSLAFSSSRSGRPEIWIADASGRSAAAQVSTGPGAKFSPTWSPDGMEIAYTSTVSGKSELEVLDIRNKSTRKLKVFGARPVEIREPDWR